MHAGEKVTKLTKKVGQVGETGRIIAVKGDCLEVKWDDGHISLISKEAVVPAKKTKA